MKTALIAALAFSVGSGLTGMLLIRAGALEPPPTITITRWAIPPNPTAPPPILPTPLTAAEQLRLQEAIKCPYVPPPPLPPSPPPPPPPLLVLPPVPTPPSTAP